MNYVTIRNGVASPIERKQLYYRNIIVYNPIILDYNIITDPMEGYINNIIDFDNIKELKIKAFIRAGNTNPSYFNICGILLLQAKYTGIVLITPNEWIDLNGNADISLIYNKEDETFYYNNKATGLTKNIIMNNNTYKQTNSSDLNASGVGTLIITCVYN